MIRIGEKKIVIEGDSRTGKTKLKKIELKK